MSSNLYTVFLPLVIENRKLRTAIKVAIEALPGFVRWEGADFTTEMTSAPLAVFADLYYAEDARTAIGQQVWVAGRVTGQIKTIVIEPLRGELLPTDELDAQVILFKLMPSATRYLKLQDAMLRYQAVHPINAEGTQR